MDTCERGLGRAKQYTHLSEILKKLKLRKQCIQEIPQIWTNIRLFIEPLNLI